MVMPAAESTRECPVSARDKIDAFASLLFHDHPEYDGVFVLALSGTKSTFASTAVAPLVKVKLGQVIEHIKEALRTPPPLGDDFRKQYTAARYHSLCMLVEALMARGVIAGPAADHARLLMSEKCTLDRLAPWDHEGNPLIAFIRWEAAKLGRDAAAIAYAAGFANGAAEAIETMGLHPHVFDNVVEAQFGRKLDGLPILALINNIGELSADECGAALDVGA